MLVCVWKRLRVRAGVRVAEVARAWPRLRVRASLRVAEVASSI